MHKTFLIYWIWHMEYSSNLTKGWWWYCIWADTLTSGSNHYSLITGLSKRSSRPTSSRHILPNGNLSLKISIWWSVMTIWMKWTWLLLTSIFCTSLSSDIRTSRSEISRSCSFSVFSLILILTSQLIVCISIVKK